MLGLTGECSAARRQSFLVEVIVARPILITKMPQSSNDTIYHFF